MRVNEGVNYRENGKINHIGRKERSEHEQAKEESIDGLGEFFAVDFGAEPKK